MLQRLPKQLDFQGIYKFCVHQTFAKDLTFHLYMLLHYFLRSQGRRLHMITVRKKIFHLFRLRGSLRNPGICIPDPCICLATSAGPMFVVSIQNLANTIDPKTIMPI